MKANLITQPTSSTVPLPSGRQYKVPLSFIHTHCHANIKQIDIISLLSIYSFSQFFFFLTLSGISGLRNTKPCADLLSVETQRSDIAASSAVELLIL